MASLFERKEISVNGIRMFLLAAAAAMGLGGCATWDGLSAGQQGAVIGAGVGGAAGAIATDGGALGTIGGAAVGGVIGNQVGKRRGRDD